MIWINGKEHRESTIILSEYLQENKLNPARIAIEYNGTILPKTQYRNTIFHDGDRIEIVQFVGGG